MYCIKINIQFNLFFNHENIMCNSSFLTYCPLVVLLSENNVLMYYIIKNENDLL